LRKEKSSGKLVLREKPFQESSQKKHGDPFPTVAIDIPLKAGKSFWMSRHQKEPFLVLVGGLPLEYLAAQTKCTYGMSNLLKNLCKFLRSRL